MDLKHVAGILKELSWKKIAQVAVFSLLTIMFILAWAIRDSFYQDINRLLVPDSAVAEIKLTPEILREVEIVTKKLKNTGVVGIEVVGVDFNSNLSYRVVFFSDNEILRKAADEFINSNQNSSIPVFSSNEHDNLKIVELLNGNFVCTPYGLTNRSKFYSGTNGVVEYVCSAPIPPFYGKFSGFINFYVSRMPTDFFLETIRKSSSDLSVFIYNKSIEEIKRQVPINKP